MRIGIIKETKTPPDSRVLLTPKQCATLITKYPQVEILVQPSPSRSYKDSEYTQAGITLQEDLSDCDILIGVKEQVIDTLIPNKKYFFFSHTAKEQEYNRTLLRAIVDKNIQLIDYEYLIDTASKRVIAFGRWAGIVGAHNGILTWGKRTGKFDLKAMNQCKDFAEAQSYYPNVDLGTIKIVLTGTGRVANGSAEVLDKMKIKKVPTKDFLSKTYNESVYCQLETEEMFKKATDGSFDKAFYTDPEDYISSFEKYTEVADLMINGIYWDNRAPVFFTKEDMKKESFNIKVIADITCDIAPDSSIPSTLFASTIAKPNFGYNITTEKATEPFIEGVVDMMTVDNLPNELPRDASEDFGNQFMDQVIEELINDGEMIFKASITTKEGKLNKPFVYLADYINI
ncbi:MAG: saccharopine dehydrogenase (NAD+, L-lysine-forming) [Planctomycetota bacterium]|jgi:saccharopine dehydrogenase (NAD+, L-lysine-forming)